LSLGCIFFAIVSARYPVYSAASHPVHLLLGVAYVLIGLGVYRIGLTVVDTIDRMDDTLPPVSPLIDLFGENAGWKLYNRVLTRIRTSEKQLSQSLRENFAKTESIQALENTIEVEAQIREELSQAKERAEAANSAKTQFLTMMSHELRTPLTSILGYSTLLANPPVADFDSRDFGVRIKTSAQHLQQLIDSILDFSSIEGGRIRLQTTTFPLEEILGFARSIGETQAKSRPLTFACVAPAQPVMMTSDPLMLRQILANLLVNAFKFTDSGEVRLDVHADDPCVSFRVTDSGVGIPESEIERVFEPFFQISRGKTRNYGGVGLGLAIVKRLSDILGGKITINSSLDQGTSIEILFPREFK
ncbi:MAG TPA: HAMP domain-containing sensor histidine kinase, partial [Candidatus Ozemobacteraceae bacterium]|nr:HAMP domain-containing sensor histidine kinase [Candidatus Ozemobacteraceae bacterium]